MIHDTDRVVARQRPMSPTPPLHRVFGAQCEAGMILHQS